MLSWHLWSSINIGPGRGEKKIENRPKLKLFTYSFLLKGYYYHHHHHYDHNNSLKDSLNNETSK